MQPETHFGCLLTRPGRGDCEHFVGYPSKIHRPNQHDGKDDTVDVYGKPNGWCWNCWWSYRTHKAEEKVRILTLALQRVWDEDECGWIVSDASREIECGKCRGKANSKSQIVHEEYCTQGFIFQALEATK